MSESKKKAFIFGIGGQDGSYLAEYLYSLGYEVHGTVRRNSVPEHQASRIDDLQRDGKINVMYGDLMDPHSIDKALASTMPDEIYNLAAQSHVRISFDVPIMTVQTNAVGVMYLLDACKRICPKARFYQASSSEMFGNSVDDDNFQRESTPMNPTSPYGCAKLFAFNFIRHYRNAYGIWACNGILFNHETAVSQSPCLFRIGASKNTEIDIKPISEIVQFHTRKDVEGPVVDEKKEMYQASEVDTGLEVWDSSGWTKVKCASGYPHDLVNNPKKPKIIISKNSCYAATGTHHAIMADDTEKEIQNIEIGDKVKITNYPTLTKESTTLMVEEAELMGLICGDGYIHPSGKYFRVINADKDVRDHAIQLWNKICDRYDFNRKYNYYSSRSGFKPENIVGYLSFNEKNWVQREHVYNMDNTKRVPKIILNSSIEIQKAFFEGYYAADGLKAGKCLHRYQRFKTDSPVLAAGLLFIYNRIHGGDYNINMEVKVREGKEFFYYNVDLLNGYTSKTWAKYETVKQYLEKGTGKREISRTTGISRKFIQKVSRGHIPTDHHNQKPNNEVKKIINRYDYDGWFYDLETESGTFQCGIGTGVIHNSPRRGSNFVTNKIVKAAVRIKLGLQDTLELGNMDSYRDWGHSKDYVRAMHCIMNHDKPDDFIVATGKTHSVRELCEYVFGKLDLDYSKYVVQNPKYIRPEELKYLKGDCSKFKETFDWEPEYTFETLMDEMIEHWMVVFGEHNPEDTLEANNSDVQQPAESVKTISKEKKSKKSLGKLMRGLSLSKKK